MFLAGRADRVEEDLEGGQALLPIDDRPILEGTVGRFHGLNDDGAEEVGRWGSRVVELVFRKPPNVLPQRRPLPLFVPNIWTLKQRNDEPLRHAEDG
jgi:hypothetical protein